MAFRISAVEPRRLNPPFKIPFFFLPGAFLRRPGSDLTDFNDLKLSLDDGRRMPEAIELTLSLEVGRRILLELTECTDPASNPFFAENRRGILRECSEAASKLPLDAGFFGTLLEETECTDRASDAKLALDFGLRMFLDSIESTDSRFFGFRTPLLLFFLPGEGRGDLVRIGEGPAMDRLGMSLATLR